MNINNLLRELSGPRPSRWVVDRANLGCWHPSTTDIHIPSLRDRVTQSLILSEMSRIHTSILGYVWIWWKVSRLCPHTLFFLLPIFQNIDITCEDTQLIGTQAERLNEPAGSNSCVSSYIPGPERDGSSGCINAGKMIGPHWTHKPMLDIGVVLDGPQGVHNKPGIHVGNLLSGSENIEHEGACLHSSSECSF